MRGYSYLEFLRDVGKSFPVGAMMGKTEQGAIWLDPKRTSPYQFIQYWKNVADDDVMQCIAFLTEIERAKLGGEGYWIVEALQDAGLINGSQNRTWQAKR